MARFETRVHLFDLCETACGEGRAGHQHEAQRNLADDESASGAAVQAAQPAPSTGTQRRNEIDPEALDGGHQRKDQRRRQGSCRGERENRPTQACVGDTRQALGTNGEQAAKARPTYGDAQSSAKEAEHEGLRQQLA